MADHDLNEEADRYRNALKWIQLKATMDYIGGAFDPDHMKAIADIACKALDGKPMPDYDARMAEARKAATETAKRFAREE